MSATKITPSSEYRQDNISLRDAMTMELAEQDRVWSVPGLHVKLEGVFADVPKNATILQTLVVKGNGLSLLGGDIFVGIHWKREESEELQCSKEFGLNWEMVQKKISWTFKCNGISARFFCVISKNSRACLAREFLFTTLISLLIIFVNKKCQLIYFFIFFIILLKYYSLY